MRPRSLPEVAFSTGLRYAAMCARTDAAYGESTLVHSIGVIGVSSSEVAVEAVLRCVKSLCLIKPQMFISTEIINSSQYQYQYGYQAGLGDRKVPQP